MHKIQPINNTAVNEMQFAYTEEYPLNHFNPVV